MYNKTKEYFMSIYEAADILRRDLNNCSYEFGSTSYQDRCEGISVSCSGNTIYVVIRMRVADPSYKREVKNNIDNIIRSISYQYELPYGIDYEIRFV